MINRWVLKKCYDHKDISLKLFLFVCFCHLLPAFYTFDFPPLQSATQENIVYQKIGRLIIVIWLSERFLLPNYFLTENKKNYYKYFIIVKKQIQFSFGSKPMAQFHILEHNFLAVLIIYLKHMVIIGVYIMTKLNRIL